MPFAEGFIESQSSTMQTTMQAESVERQVLIFCQIPRTRAEIQEHLGFKNRDYFRKSILSPLIEAGTLRLTLPDKPTSPKQKFYAEDQQ
ncbi:Fic family protein [Marinomonas shanghaiensis]|uniref:Fic family protein n=1 Tax=Marinomonas shanghaiensis TaxID=2202418 RepID=UPI003A8EEE62